MTHTQLLIKVLLLVGEEAVLGRERELICRQVGAAQGVMIQL